MIPAIVTRSFGDYQSQTKPFKLFFYLAYFVGDLRNFRKRYLVLTINEISIFVETTTFCAYPYLIEEKYKEVSRNTWLIEVKVVFQ